MDNDTARMKAIFVFVATLAFVAGSYLVSFSGFAPEQFPVPQVDPPVQPAGYAFAIWGVIFLWLILSSGFGLFKRAEDGAWDAMRWPLIVTFAVGASWNTVANTSAVWATVLIWVMLIAALIAVLRAPKHDIGWLALPIGLYAGWLTAASSVSIGLLLAGYGVLGETTAAVLGVALAGLISANMLFLTPNPAYAAAVLWALVAIVVKNTGSDSAAMLAGIIGALLVAAAFFIALSRSREA